MRRVASIPSMRGIRTSMRTTSGRSRAARSTATAPSGASPRTVSPSAASMITRRPSRTTFVFLFVLVFALEAQTTLGIYGFFATQPLWLETLALRLRT